MTSDATSYASQWRELRRRNRLSWAAYLLMCGAGTAGLASQQWYWWIIALLLFLGAVAAGAYLSSFPCPRCQKPFLERGLGWSNIYSRKCLNCGLRQGALPEGSS